MSGRSVKGRGGVVGGGGVAGGSWKGNGIGRHGCAADVFVFSADTCNKIFL